MILSAGEIILRRYQRLEQLEQQPWGELYRGWDLNFDREILLAAQPDTPENTARLAVDGPALTLLEHPRLAICVDAFRVPDRGCFRVFTAPPGVDLAAWVKQHGPVSEARMVHWTGEVLDALEYLHDRRPMIVHGDLRPERVRITDAGSACLIYLGLPAAPIAGRWASGALHVPPPFIETSVSSHAGGSQTHANNDLDAPPDPDAPTLPSRPAAGAPDGPDAPTLPSRPAAGPTALSPSDPAKAITADLRAVAMLLYFGLIGGRMDATGLAVTLPRLSPRLIGVLRRALQPDPNLGFAGAADLRAALDTERSPGARIELAPQHRMVVLPDDAPAESLLAGDDDAESRQARRRLIWILIVPIVILMLAAGLRSLQNRRTAVEGASAWIGAATLTAPGAAPATAGELAASPAGELSVPAAGSVTPGAGPEAAVLPTALASGGLTPGASGLPAATAGGFTSGSLPTASAVAQLPATRTPLPAPPGTPASALAGTETPAPSEPSSTQTSGVEAPTAVPSPQPGDVEPTAVPAQPSDVASIPLLDWKELYFLPVLTGCPVPDAECYRNNTDRSATNAEDFNQSTLTLTEPIFIDPAWSAPQLIFRYRVRNTRNVQSTVIDSSALAAPFVNLRLASYRSVAEIALEDTHDEWSSAAIPLGDYAGQEITIQFVIGKLWGWFFINDVQIDPNGG